MFLSSVNQYKKQGYLLLDETTVAAASDCRLQFFQAAKDPASPMITATEKILVIFMNFCILQNYRLQR